MGQSTHAIQLDIGLDMVEILKPENMPGLKLALGADSEDDLMNLVAVKFTQAVESALSSPELKGFGGVIEQAQLASLEGDVESGDSRATDWTPSPEDVTAVDEEDWKDFDIEESQVEDVVFEDDSDSDIEEEEEFDFGEVDETDEIEEVSEEDVSDIDPEFIKLSEHIAYTVVTVQFMAADDIHVYVSDYSKYGEDLGKYISDDISVHNINRSRFKDLEDIDDIAYVLTYKAISEGDKKQEKSIAVKYDELNKEEEAVGEKE